MTPVSLLGVGEIHPSAPRERGCVRTRDAKDQSAASPTISGRAYGVGRLPSAR